MAPVQLDTDPEPSKSPPPGYANRGLLWSGVAGACVLGVAAGLWARPGLAERRPSPHTQMKPVAQAPQGRLQIIVDDTPAPIGAPIEVLPAYAAPAPQVVAPPVEMAPKRPVQGLMRVLAVGPVTAPEPEPEAQPEIEAEPRKALRLPHINLGGAFHVLARMVRTPEPQAAPIEEAPVVAEAKPERPKRASKKARAAELAQAEALKREADAKAAEQAQIAEAKAEEARAAKARRQQARLAAQREAEAQEAADRRRAEIRQAKADAAAAERKAARAEQARLAAAEAKAQKARAARIERVRLEKARAEDARLEKARLIKAKAEKVRSEKVRAEKAKLEKVRRDAERLQVARAERAAEKARAEKIRLAAARTEKLAQARKAEKARAAQIRLASNTSPRKANRCASPDVGEALVCADPQLSAADRRLTRAYREAQAAGVPEWRLQQQQDRWRAARSAAAREAPWQVREVYLARIAELNDMASNPGNDN